MSGNRTLEGKNAVIAEMMMREVSAVLERCNIPYILEAGTLLGVIRENRLLPWDNDVDFTITSEYEQKLLKNLWRIKLLGYYVTVKRYKKDISFFKKGETRIIKIKHINFLKLFKKDVVLEIFVKKKVGSEYFWTEGLNPPVLKNCPEEYHDNLTNYLYKGKGYLIPKNYYNYLKYRYGENWRTPVKEWDFRKNDCCIREVLG